MSNEAVFTMQLEPELRDAFAAAAVAAHRPEAELVCEMMRDFIAGQTLEAEYDKWLLAKVATARQSIGADVGRSNDEVAAEAAQWRDEILASIKT